ncbi:MAG: UbiA family prenyltransferase, partial [Oscillochloris sp.]|nr:UbiA family prenyltransferase [Oscillochloris sp.]
MLLDAYRFFRFSASGATAVLPLLGAGSVCSQLEARRTLELLGVAAAFHAFAYVHNDVCDLAIDRTQPLRADYPLVRGAISPRAALTIALACVPTAFAIGRRDAAPGRLSLVGAFGLMAAYNRWGKACPFPPLTDLLQGAGWALLIAYGATADGEVPTRLTQLLLAYELLLILMVNGVHGALRDLENDQSCGAQTTAIMFGARQTAGGMQLPPALLAYALLLQLALLALPIYAASQNLPGHQGGARLATGLGVA